MTPIQASDFILSRVSRIDIIPVLAIDDVSIGMDLAHALVDAGMSAIEVTLRTDNALKVIEAMASVSGATVAAGTVLNESQLLASREAGAEFVVSPGSTPALLQSAQTHGIPLLPGAATASEIMALFESGFHFQKFFPAAINGGVGALRSLGAPLPNVSFCPTGGVNATNVTDYLALDNVVCVGGSWMITAQDMANRDWDMIGKRVGQAS
ncbi:MAG: bifunctional 4-hydroxy-2-oxoglutarate aldolase/2-dehydro-3-deoxy-phosphogluconate aldolase [Gammaproteobacteria bacterium]|nr:bifunctional 4-hydroxy-2-oxoglutarate aldolase/2-dehydro-3-deoxy-phosphogluconate aldolase [Gammaproteobacteria bacterium]